MMDGDIEMKSSIPILNLFQTSISLITMQANSPQRSSYDSQKYPSQNMPLVAQHEGVI